MEANPAILFNIGCVAIDMLKRTNAGSFAVICPYVLGPEFVWNVLMLICKYCVSISVPELTRKSALP